MSNDGSAAVGQSKRYNMRTIGVTICATLLVSAVASFNLSFHAYAKVKEATIIFRVSNNRSAENASLEPIVLLSGDKYVEPPDYWSDPGASNFVKRYLGKGTTYRLLHRGVYAADTTVMSASDKYIAGTVPAIRPPGEMLATDSKILGRRHNAFRAVSRKDAAEFLRLTKHVLRAKGASSSAVASASVVHLAATDLNGDGVVDYVGNAFAREQKPPVIDTMFVIAKRNKGQLDVVLSDFRKIQPKDLMRGVAMEEIKPDFLAPRFLDQLDINQDGTDEVFYLYPSFEGVHYGIYQSKGDKWGRAYEHYHYIAGY